MLQHLRIAAVLFGVALAGSWAPSAAAEDLAALCERVGKVEVGQWAEYRVKGLSPAGATKLRLAVVGKQPVAGSDAFWIELDMQGGENRMIAQVLARGYPYRSDQVHEMVMKAGDQPALKMPSAALGMMRARMGVTPSMGAADRCREAKVLGTETVEVPAGSFRALHLESADEPRANVWAKAEIPFGMIKVVHAEGEIVLLGHGRDAKSRITETPQSLPGFGR